MKTKTVRTKRRCCKSSPRCKRCPTVLKRLASAGLAERVDGRTYKVDAALTRKQLRTARRKRL